MANKRFLVAKIDALQAEYSAFETIHETDGLIDTARELGVAYVAYSPLGHGWLVDDFEYESPEDFAKDDFRRTCTSHSILLFLPILPSPPSSRHSLLTLIHSPKVPRRKFLREQSDC